MDLASLEGARRAAGGVGSRLGATRGTVNFPRILNYSGAANGTRLDFDFDVSRRLKGGLGRSVWQVECR